jgi:hypothetical protein
VKFVTRISSNEKANASRNAPITAGAMIGSVMRHSACAARAEIPSRQLELSSKLA